MFGTGYYSDVSPLYNEEDGFDEYDADNGVLSACAVNKGDRVMIQSKITGELQSDACSILINVSRRLAKSKRKPRLFTSWLAFVLISFFSLGFGFLVLPL